MPFCPKHGFYIGQCLPCKMSGEDASLPETPELIPEDQVIYNSESPPLPPHGSFVPIIEAAAGFSWEQLAELIGLMINSHKNTGFGNKFNLKGLEQRWEELTTQFSEVDSKHRYYYGQQLNALKILLGMYTDKGGRFSRENWEYLNRLMNRPPPGCKPLPKSWRDDHDRGSTGGSNYTGVRVAPKKRLSLF